jgi:hypothetical protein
MRRPSPSNALVTFCGIAAALLASSGIASAVTYDAVTDFSVTNGNPNGVWTYLDNGTPLAFTHTGQGPSNNVEYWSNTQPGVPDNVLVGHTTSGTATLSNTVQFSTTFLTIDPEGHTAGVRFTAPSAGIYDIVGQFFAADTAERTHPVFIIDSLSGTIFSQTISGSQSQPFNLMLNLTAGETIDFLTSPMNLTDNCYFCDLSTALQASISTVDAGTTPLPAAMPLMLTGLAGVGLLVRRRRKLTKSLQ